MIGVLGAVMLAGPAVAQQPSIADLMQRIDALQRPVDGLEGRQEPATPPAPRRARAAAPATAPQVTQAPAPLAVPASSPAPVLPSVANASARALPPPAVAAKTPATEQAAATIPGLLPPEPMGSQFENALRSDLPGLSVRMPGTNSTVRLYGFAKVSGYTDLNGRNQTDAPPPQTTPLNNSAADKQGGDFGMAGRFSLIGVDTRTVTDWGTLETRIEGNFGGGAPTSSNAVFRLRQAWAKLGGDALRVRTGQANGLWNEGIFETLIDATNLRS